MREWWNWSPPESEQIQSFGVVGVGRFGSAVCRQLMQNGADVLAVDRSAKAIEELRPEYRTVLLLWGVEGLKYREIAEIQEVPIGTVMSRLHRARSVLARQLADLTEETGHRSG